MPRRIYLRIPSAPFPVFLLLLASLSLSLSLSLSRVSFWKGGMGDRLLNRPIKARVDSKAEDSLVVDAMTIGWTDEKHMLYLNSLEASFVDRLYSSGDPMKDFLGWPTRTQKDTNLYRSNDNNSVSQQPKVLHKRRCENLKIEKTTTGANGNEFHHLTANPWIQHFRSSSYGEGLHVRTADGHESATRPILVEDVQSERVISSTRLPSLCRLRNSNYICEVTEVSDQNFLNEDDEARAESSRARKKRRSESPAADMLSDQVVPSGKPLGAQGSGENHDHLRGKDSDHHDNSSKVTTGFLDIESVFIT